jgi:putative flippase GtrA
MEIIRQSLKYGVVGIGNTLLSLVIIWIMTRYGGCTHTFSNFTGYAIGLINSYLWNRQWTFHSDVNWKNGAIRFLGVFAMCYVLQLGLLLLLNRYSPEHPPAYDFFSPLLWFKVDPLFYNQILSTAFYTVINFIINKFYTFKA